MKVHITNWSRVLLLSLSVSTSLVVGGCSTTGTKEKELDVNTLDPNAPALPPELAATPTPEAVAAAPMPTPAPEASSTVKEETTTPPPAAVANDKPVTTPKVEEILKEGDDDSGEPIGTLDDSGKKAPVANDDADVSAPDSSGPSVKPRVGNPNGGPRVFGSGKQKRFIKADQLHIRVQPDRYSKSIGIIYGGDEVHVTIRGDWAKLEEGQWIRSRWLVKTAPRKFRSDGSSSTGDEPVKKKKKAKRRSKRSK